KAFLRAVAERRRPVLEEHISAVLGRSVAVRCVATNIDVLPELPSDDEAAWILAEARRIFGEEGADPAEVGRDATHARRLRIPQTARANLGRPIDGHGQPATHGDADAAGDGARPGRAGRDRGRRLQPRPGRPPWCD